MCTTQSMFSPDIFEKRSILDQFGVMMEIHSDHCPPPLGTTPASGSTAWRGFILGGGLTIWGGGGY